MIAAQRLEPAVTIRMHVSEAWITTVVGGAVAAVLAGVVLYMLLPAVAAGALGPCRCYDAGCGGNPAVHAL